MMRPPCRSCSADLPPNALRRCRGRAIPSTTRRSESIARSIPSSAQRAFRRHARGRLPADMVNWIALRFRRPCRPRINTRSPAGATTRSGALRHRVGGAARLRVVARRRARADPCGGRRRRNRGDPVGQGRRGRDTRHGVTGQARAARRVRRRPRHRLPQGRLVERIAALRHRARRDGRQVAEAVLRH